jgi:very-short-patch-repair endonuclease
MLYFKSTSTMKGTIRPKKGLVDFRANPVDPSMYSALLRGKQISVSSLHAEAYGSRDQVDAVPEGDEDVDEDKKRKKKTQWGRLITSYEEVIRKARENFEERNIETLYLVRGLMSWRREDPGPEPLAPLILIPLSVESKGRGHTDFNIQISGEPIFNDALKLFLKTQLSIEPDELGVLDKVDFPTLGELKKYFAPLAKTLPHGVIEEVELIGNFSFFKLPLVADMDRIIEGGFMHPILRALAGDEQVLEEIAPFEDGDEMQSINDLAPKDEFLVFPTDRSQHLAVSAITRGKTIVIQGPPGTGKSQTIANAIAELSAMGKKTLFVAEKRAAIDAVVSRLTDQGLASLVLDLHGEPDKKKIASQLLEVLYENKHKKAGFQGNDAALQSAKDKMQRRWADLNNLSGVSLEQGSELTVYEALQTLGDLVSQQPVDIVWPREIERKLLGQLSFGALKIVQENLNTLSMLKWIDGKDQHAGRGLIDFVKTQDQALELRVGIERLQEALLAEYSTALDKFERDNGYAIRTLGEADKLVKQSTYVDAIGSTWNLEEFARAMADMGRICTYKELKLVKEFDNPFKAWIEARRRSKILRKCVLDVPERSRSQLKDEQNAIFLALKSHADHSHSGPQVPEVASNLLQTILRDIFEVIGDIKDYGPLLGDLLDLPRPQLNSRIEMLYSDLALIRELPTVAICRTHLDELGELPKRILDWFEDEQPALSAPGDWFFRWWLEVALETMVAASDANLNLIDSGSMDRVLERYQSLDESHITQNAARAHEKVKARVIAISDTAGFSKLRREADKKSAHHPFRMLIQDARAEVLTLKPCLAMSPIAVSRLIPCEYGIFDVVIFDEASQITPEDAVPSIFRATQVVVAGDRHQLGPTEFGRASDSDEYSEDDIEGDVATRGLESILDSLRGILPISSTYPLNIHYRSQDERLITFSNKAFYIPNNQALFSFPSREANPRKALGYVLVPEVQTKSMREEANTKEIAAVIDQILDHVATRPEDSLGVIAFGDQHKRRIEDALLKLERENDSYFDFVSRTAGTREPLFIKSIERVQGDERDCIIMTPGYARGDKGTLRYQFGSLGRQGGERRLNVAASRAKRKLTLVTSITSEDFAAYKGGERGVQLFKAFIQYMESQGLSSDLGDLPPAPENPFEEQILSFLTKRGMKIDCQVGDSGYRIDFAVRHPAHEDEYLLAIEADGASYHSSDYARERDIVRQRVLENRGWKFVRIWSTDWFRNREGEVEKVVAAYKNALANEPSARRKVESEVKVSVVDAEAPNIPIDERLFKGLKQAKPRIPKEQCLEEWMQLCGYMRRTKKTLERFEDLWRGKPILPKTTPAPKKSTEERTERGTKYEHVGWIRGDEIRAASTAFETAGDQMLYPNGSSSGSLLHYHASSGKGDDQATCAVKRMREGVWAMVAELTQFEVDLGLRVLASASGFQGKSPDGREDVLVEYLPPMNEANMDAASVRIYRRG